MKVSVPFVFAKLKANHRPFLLPLVQAVGIRCTGEFVLKNFEGVRMTM